MISSTQQPSPVAAAPARTRSGLIALILCFVTLVADGYDLIVYGASVLQLLSEPGLNMQPATAGAIGSWTLIGMMVGFLPSGPLTGRFGGRRILILGGRSLDSSLSQGWNLYVFAVPLALAAIAVTFVPGTGTPATPLDTSELQPAQRNRLMPNTNGQRAAPLGSGA